MNRGRRLQRIAPQLMGAIGLLISMVALAAAVAAYDRPIGGILVDPQGIVFSMGFADWDGIQEGLRFPDALVSVEGTALRDVTALPKVTVWDEAVRQAWQRREKFVTATFTTGNGLRTVRLRVRRLEPIAWWTFAGSLLLAGWLFLVGGLIALQANPANRLAVTFAKVSFASGLLLITLFDFHTTRLLVPVFYLAFAYVPIGWIVLGLRLPDDAFVLRRWPRLEVAGDLVATSLGLALLVGYFTGHSTQWLQVTWSPVLGAGFLLFFGTCLVRLVTAKDARRTRLGAILSAAALPYVGVGSLGVLAGRFGWSWTGTKLIPLPLVSLVPLATAYAFIRYDLWGSRALLSRILTRIGLAALAVVFSIAGATALSAGLGVPFPGALLSAAVSGAATALLVLAALKLADRFIFQSRAAYKPTVEQLSSELLSIKSPSEVGRAVERTIARWLPCNSIELSPAKSPHEVPSDDVSAYDASSDPRRIGDTLELPVRFGHVELGILRVGQKRGGALFTEDDVDLLRTIAHQGALALAHAFAYEELEQLRQRQAAAWRGERRALVETVAAEVAHEVRYPINFFRTLFEQSNREEPLSDEDIEIGLEEVDRLERLVSRLRKLAAQPLRRQATRVDDLCSRVETLLRDELGSRSLERALPEDARIVCDPDKMTQILVNLVANALQAAGPRGSVGVAWSLHGDGAKVVVWDNGPGFADEPAKLFAPLYTTKKQGTGLGLAISHRLVRQHGWRITAARRSDRTLFVISIRSQDIIDAQSPSTPHEGTRVA